MTETAHAPLSQAQLAIWLHEQLHPGSAVYNLSHVFEINTHLDVAVWAAAPHHIASLQPAQRTNIIVGDHGQPQQVVSSVAKPGLVEVVDGRGLDDTMVEELIGDAAARPFDLANDPLYRSTLISVADDSHIVVSQGHHIVSDMWSLALWLDAAARFYAVQTGHEVKPQRAPRITPAQHAVAERDWLRGPAAASELAYWVDQADVLPTTVLPASPTFIEDLSVVPPGNAAPISREFDIEFTASLSRFGRDNNVDMSDTVIAALGVVLGHYAASDEVVIGGIRSGRSSSNARTMGVFVNEVMLKLAIDRSESLADAVRQVGLVCKAAAAHDRLPIGTVLSTLRDRRSIDGSPDGQPFQVGFGWQVSGKTADKSFISALALGIAGVDAEVFGLPIRTRRPPTVAATSPLMVFAAVLGGRLHLSVAYQPHRLKAITAKRLLDHLETVLRSTVLDPATPVGVIDLIGPAEAEIQHQHLDGPIAASTDDTIIDLFTAAVAATPDRSAVSDKSTRLSYGQLSNEVNRLTIDLRSHGVVPGDYVGIHVERSVSTVIAVLAVLSCGAVYVPVDPGYPEDRQAFILTDSGAKVVVVDSKVPSLPKIVAQVSVTPEQRLIQASTPSLQDDALRCPVSPEDGAYLMYTSGSTGRPKGVLVTHGTMANLIRAIADRPGFGSDDCILAIASLSFDISILEQLLPLSVGGQVVIADAETVRDGQHLAAAIEASSATIFQATPATWRMLITSGWNGASDLRLWSTGEELTRDLADQLLDRSAGVWNLYGPTETHVCTVEEVGRANGPVPIGRPIANTRLQIVDKELQPLVVGLQGELLVGGIAIAAGYHGRPELTAERFVEKDGVRWYRTGDLVRLDDAGQLRFDGRIDHQVKLRGHRIELGEIESTLVSHATVAEAVVVLQTVESGDQRLVGYVTESSGVSVDPDELFGHLALSLPVHMVPAAIEILDSMPRTHNKKTDRALLPVPQRWARKGGELLVAPRSAAERTLIGIWCEVLGLVEAGINDDFFDLGGHSLLATQIVSRVRSRLGADIGLREVYANPTVARLATVVEQSERVAAFDIPTIDRSGPLPLSYSQQRMWFLHQLLPNGSGYNMAGAMRVSGPLDIQILEAAFSDVVKRHEALRTRFVTIDGEPRQVIEEPWAATIQIVDHTSHGLDQAKAEAAAATAMSTAAAVPFRLDELPLVRLVAHRLRPDEHLLYINVHHIIGDEWSFGVLSEEVVSLYASRFRGEPPDLADLTIQHADYASWHMGWLEAGALEGQLGYWRSQLANLPTLELPTDRPRPQTLSGQGETIEVDLTDEILASITDLARRKRTSPFVVLLAGFKVMLHRYTGATDLVVGSPIANRNVLESERLISSLVNTMILRTEVHGEMSFADVIERVQDTSMNAFTNQDVPFERLVEELQPERDMSRSPLFQLFFNVLTAPFDPTAFPGTSVTESHVERGAAQFDLTMTVSMNRRRLGVEYSTDLFDRDRIERFLDHYVAVLRVGLDEPASQIGSIDFRSPEERDAVASTWGHDSQESFADGALLHDLVAAQAATAPDRTAAASDGVRFSYGQLDLEANRLANHLTAIGVGRGDVVGILLKRSAWSVVAMVGVNRCGAAFVPLDPEFPSERLQFMLDDAGARGLVADSDLRDRLDLDPGLAVCRLDVGDHAEAGDEAPNLDMVSTDLAWIMYTSGSTGRPKGTEIEHRAAVNLFTSMAFEPGMTPDDVVMSVTSVSFDPSIQDGYLPLMHGAMVYIAAQSAVVDGHELAALLVSTGATQMFSTPMTWSMLIQAGWSGSPRFCAQSGGEELPRPLANELLARSGSVWNLYGLTETTIWSAAERIAEGNGPVAVGTPIANTSFHILDVNGAPSAVGVPGELYIGGIGVGRRFRNRPDLDAERIIPNPNPEDSHKRLYRTGDIAVYDLDGHLVFRGRADDQVKIRGRRVEVAEIERTLADHPGVEGAVVNAFRLETGATSLAAYLVPRAGSAPTDASLRDHLQRYLPSYMLPVVYTRLGAFPLTPNRKVDRRALPKPVLESENGDQWEAPNDELESRLAGIWELHLRRSKVGRNDDFFEIGGHSLMAMRVFADIEELTGRSYPVSALFRGPTVAKLAEVVRSDWETPFTSLVEVQSDGNRRPFFSVSPFLITTLSYELLSRHLGPDQPVYALQPQGIDNELPVHHRIEDMAAHYVNEIKVVQPEGPYRIGGHCAGSWVALEMGLQLQREGEIVELLVLVDSAPPNFDIPTPAWWRTIAARITQYRKTGRLRDAVAWQLALTRQRFLLRWTGGKTQRRIHRVRSAHAAAHSVYRANQTFEGDAVLVRSQESVDFIAEDWHLNWRERVTGDLRVRVVPGTHAGMMLDEESTTSLAHHLTEAFDELAP